MLQPKEPPPLTIEVVTDPDELAKARAQRAKFERNWAWYKDHLAEVYAEANRGKYFCIAGQELFVADDPAEVVRLARAAHPEDEGYFADYVPREKAVRIYAHQR